MSELTDQHKELIAITRNANIGIEGIFKKLKKDKITITQALVEIALENKKAVNALKELGINGI